MNGYLALLALGGVVFVVAKKRPRPTSSGSESADIPATPTPEEREAPPRTSTGQRRGLKALRAFEIIGGAIAGGSSGVRSATRS